MEAENPPVPWPIGYHFIFYIFAPLAQTNALLIGMGWGKDAEVLYIIFNGI